MGLFLSKLLPQLIYPLSLFIWLAILAGVAVWFGRKRLAVTMLSTAIVIFWIVSTPVFSNYFRAGLERTYLPLPVSESPTADAIVMSREPNTSVPIFQNTIHRIVTQAIFLRNIGQGFSIVDISPSTCTKPHPAFARLITGLTGEPS